MCPESSSPLPATRRKNEEALLADLRAGKEAAFETLVREYGGALRSVALRILKRADEADDAVQEAFLSAFRSLARFQGGSSLGTWLHQIAVNAALMRLRRTRRHPEASVEELFPRFAPRGPFAAPPPGWAEAADEPALREEDCEAVRLGIAELPENLRIPLLLRDIEGMGNAEVAAQLGLTVNAAKIRVHRARQALRSLLEPRFAEPGR